MIENEPRCVLDVCRNPPRLVHCLICHKPQTKIEHHLKNSCLRDADDGCIQEEVSRAKVSQEKWTREGRIVHLCNAVDKYGKKEAGTGEHLTHLIK